MTNLVLPDKFLWFSSCFCYITGCWVWSPRFILCRW